MMRAAYTVDDKRLAQKLENLRPPLARAGQVAEGKTAF
jgi:hypothetical protein